VVLVLGAGSDRPRRSAHGECAPDNTVRVLHDRAAVCLISQIAVSGPPAAEVRDADYAANGKWAHQRVQSTV
jgi:hypothetical protein